MTHRPKSCVPALALTFFTVLLAASASSQAAPDVSPVLASKVRPLLAAAGLKLDQVGILAVDATSGKTILAFSPNRVMAPASNVKLLTTAAALDAVGPDARYETRLYARGKIDPQGTLHGDLLLLGSGDPSLSHRFFNGDATAPLRAWAEQLVAAGVRQVTGDLILDDLCFDRQYVHPSWNKKELSRSYCAPVAGLAFNENCIEVLVSPGKKAGDKATIIVSPATGYVTIVNRCVTVKDKKRHVLAFHRQPGTNRILVKGKVWAKSRPWHERVTVDQPALFLGTVFRELLARRGVPLRGRPLLATEPTDVRGGQVKLVARTTSLLERAVRLANRRSHNLFAEQIFKTLGSLDGGEGTFRSGARAVHRFLAKVGVPKAQVTVADGSGLSRQNRCSAAALVKVLRYAHRRPWGRTFRASLAASGADGTLRRRLAAKPFRGRVWGKTGTASGTSCLAGYLRTLDDRWIAFAMLMNARLPVWKMRKAQDAICRELVTLGRGQGAERKGR